MQYSSSGAGGSNHLACVLLNAAIGINVTHIPYRGGGQAMQDLLGGPRRLPVPERADRDAADHRQDREGDRDPEQEPLAEPAGPGVRARAGADRLRHSELVRAVPAEGHAGRDRPQAERRCRCRHEHAGDAGAAEDDRLRPGRAGAPVAGIPRPGSSPTRSRNGPVRSAPAASSFERQGRAHEIAGTHAADGAAALDPALRAVLSDLHRIRADHRRGARRRRPHRLGRGPHLSGIEPRDARGRLGVLPRARRSRDRQGYARRQGDHFRPCRRQQGGGDRASDRDRDA